jgi:predicted dehydrogenase
MPIEGRTEAATGGRLRYGMVGGGPDAFIGAVHRAAMAMDGLAVPAAGCFSSHYRKTLETGAALGMAPDRLYRNFRAMILAESQRPDGIDVLVIVTPNHLHYDVAKLALEHGLHVVCDKPLVTSSAQGRELAALAKRKKALFCVTYAYTGYPMVRHMREMVAHGDLGEIRFVAAEYPQDWLATPLERTGQKQARWRTDPARAGLSNCVGDIGSHVENLVSHVTGLEIRSLLARLDRFGPGRSLDDNASILVEYKGGAKGMYWASQVAVGQDNGLRVRIFGTKASVEWAQEDPNYCQVAYVGQPTVRLSRGRDQLYPAAARLSRVPAGHPEGYFEAFANVYRAFAGALVKVKAGKKPTAEDLDFPGIADGMRGVRFIEACVASSSKGAAWVKF